MKTIARILRAATMMCMMHCAWCVDCNAQAYAHLRLYDGHKAYPDIKSICFPGSMKTLDTYNAIYGHGAIMESDWVAIRIYMDHRQSIDVYGKQRKQMELSETNFYTTDEDMKKGYGCDILWAGTSVAAGSFRGLVDGQTTYVDSVQWREQEVIENGPERAVVEVRDRGWHYNGHNIDMVQRYTMRAGSRDVEVEVELRGHEDGDLFATGVQKLEMDNEGFIDRDRCLMGSWGRNVADKNLPSHICGVGLGIKVDPANVVEMREDDVNYLCVLRPQGGRIRYTVSIYSTLQPDGHKTAKSWFEELRGSHDKIK